jgi:hypothetical protein
MRTADPVIPVSWGELIDKITILEIKARSLVDAAALANIRRELGLLTDTASRAQVLDERLLDLKERLARTNAALWDIENLIRAKEARGAFDAEFVELARSVYRTNDLRAALKREINLHLGSTLIEEKGYTAY